MFQLIWGRQNPCPKFEQSNVAKLPRKIMFTQRVINLAKLKIFGAQFGLLLGWGNFFLDSSTFATLRKGLVSNRRTVTLQWDLYPYVASYQLAGGMNCILVYQNPEPNPNFCMKVIIRVLSIFEEYPSMSNIKNDTPDWLIPKPTFKKIYRILAKRCNKHIIQDSKFSIKRRIKLFHVNI